MENLVVTLICLPFLMAAVLALISNDKIRGYLVYLFVSVIGALSLFTAVSWAMKGEIVTFDLPYAHEFNTLFLVGDIVLMILIIVLCIKFKRAWIGILSVIHTVAIVWIELKGPELKEMHHMRFDWMTFLMVLIIGLVGGLIGMYAMGYMRGYHKHHKDVTDRRKFFFAMIFIFYGAMFGLVTSANIIWLDFFWEVTSVCSFLLISYTKSDEAIANACRALWMNLLGGLGFAVAIVMGAYNSGTADLYELIEIAEKSTEGGTSLALVPIAMLGFAALTKSAQFPFSSWLLGAMVAPTPSSALLHSATMVKAGVYLLVRIAPATFGNYVGDMICMVGGFTFFVASLLAISQSDGKKVLAYSTISNLGLITACAGMGNQGTVWAAVLLIIFHAVSKSMLFQCVGAIENTTGSRDIENMQGLAVRLPKLAFILMVGIAGMYLAPFGMLVSKWAALRAFVDTQSTLMVLFIVFGSSTTMFYWTKWMAKILGLNQERQKDVTQRNEYCSMFLHAGMIILLCLGFPLVSSKVVIPLIEEAFMKADEVLSNGNMIIMIIMVATVFIVPIVNYIMTRNVKDKKVIAYMGGANAGDNKTFVDSFGEDKKLQVSNWYMESWFGETKIFRPAILFGALILIAHLCLIIGGAI